MPGASPAPVRIQSATRRSDSNLRRDNARLSGIRSGPSCRDRRSWANNNQVRRGSARDTIRPCRAARRLGPRPARPPSRVGAARRMRTEVRDVRRGHIGLLSATSGDGGNGRTFGGGVTLAGSAAASATSAWVSATLPGAWAMAATGRWSAAPSAAGSCRSGSGSIPGGQQEQQLRGQGKADRNRPPARRRPPPVEEWFMAAPLTPTVLSAHFAGQVNPSGSRENSDPALDRLVTGLAQPRSQARPRTCARARRRPTGSRNWRRSGRP